MVLLVVIAALVGLPYLWDAPRFRDETFNALRSLAIYRGELAPLTDVELYMGSFYNYVVAGLFWVTGPTIYGARLVVAVFAAATVGVAYLLGREVGGRAVGVITAALLLTNGVHVAAVGHVGFSAHISPFFTAAGFWLLHRAMVRRSGPALALAGFAFGMGLHTHPTTVAYLIGALGWFLVVGRSWLRTRWPYVALLAFTIAYSLETGGESIRHAIYTATERPDYARGRDTSLTVQAYISRQHDFWLMLYRTVGGALDDRRSESDYLRDPALAIAGIVALASTLWAARRGYALPLWAVGSLAVVLPIFNATHYDVVGDANYVVKTLPLIYACVALATVTALRQLRRIALRPLRIAASVGLAALLIQVYLVYSLWLLNDYYRVALRAEPPNRVLIAAAGELLAARAADEVVVLDNRLNERRVADASPWDEESTFRIMRLILEFEEVSYEIDDLDDDILDDLVARDRSAILIVSSGRNSRDTDRLNQLIAEYDLRALDGAAGQAPRPADRFAVLRLHPAAPTE